MFNVLCYGRIITDSGANVPSGLHANMRHFRTDTGQPDKLAVRPRNVARILDEDNSAGFLHELCFALQNTENIKIMYLFIKFGTIDPCIPCRN